MKPEGFSFFNGRWAVLDILCWLIDSLIDWLKNQSVSRTCASGVSYYFSSSCFVCKISQSNFQSCNTMLWHASSNDKQSHVQWVCQGSMVIGNIMGHSCLCQGKGRHCQQYSVLANLDTSCKSSILPISTTQVQLKNC